MCLPESILSIIGARRTPSVISPVANTNSAISICTSYGFRQLEVVDYIKAVRQLRPDIVLAPADVVFGRSVSSRRIDKMGTRSITWLGALLAELRAMSGENEAPIPALFAPILAIDAGLQTDYLENLVEELPNGVNGIATYDTSVLLDIPSELKPLPRLSLSEPGGPVQLLREIYLGIDICTSPFVGAATDAGIALTFTFANESGKNDERLPLAIDLWEPSYKVDTGPIFASCSCYACQTHHKAYIHHLLTAQEMLAWVLLQIHNCSMMDAFFTAVRKSIGDGSFETLKGEFELLYEPELPQQTGAGPR